jgi:hypothetical protein
MAFGQEISTQEISLPTGSTNSIQAVSTAPDGRLWVVAKPQPVWQFASLMMQSALGSASFQTIANTLQQSTLEATKNIYGNIARMDSFFPQNGTTSVFGPETSTVTFTNGIGVATTQDFEWTASPSGWKQTCTDYTVNGTGKSPTIRSGPYFGSDGAAYYYGTEGTDSTIYLRDRVSKGICNLVPKDASIGVPLLQIWPQTNGTFLVERTIAADGLNWATTEVGILSNGKMTMLVSPNAQTNPAVSATKCCDMVWDSANQTALITYRDGNEGHAFLYQQGQK